MAPESSAPGLWDAAGWLHEARRVDSPNFDARPVGETVRLLVIHAISLPPNQFGGGEVEAFFTNQLQTAAHPFFEQIATLKVSAHFYIQRTGALTQFVSADQRAWHAGVSMWQGRERCNDFSIGVELEGCDTCGFTKAQYQRLAKLAAVLQTRYPIEAIKGHADIAPGRKTDPGPFFDWLRLRRLLRQNTAQQLHPSQAA